MKWLIFKKAFDESGAHVGYSTELRAMYIRPTKVIPKTDAHGVPLSGRLHYTLFEPFATHFPLDEAENEKIYSPSLVGESWVLMQDQVKIDALAAETSAKQEREQLENDVASMKASAITAIDNDSSLSTPIKNILKVLVRKC